MTIIISPIRVEARPEDDRFPWELTEDVHYSDGLGWGLTVPRSFRFDMASVPRLLWPVFPPFGRYLAAATIHDWLYREQPISRDRADAIFLSAMAAAGVPAWKRWVMYLAVRIGGGRSWRKNAKAKAAAETADP